MQVNRANKEHYDLRTNSVILATPSRRSRNSKTSTLISQKGGCEERRIVLIGRSKSRPVRRWTIVPKSMPLFDQTCACIQRGSPVPMQSQVLRKVSAMWRHDHRASRMRFRQMLYSGHHEYNFRLLSRTIHC